MSEYDIVATNALCLGEAVKKKLVLPLAAYINAATISALDFHPTVLPMGT